MPEAIIAADRINGWAGIARHLRCDVTTAIRWAREAGLPVHQPSGRRGAVHAYRHELDEWLVNSYRVEALADGRQRQSSDSPAQSYVSPQAEAATAPVINQPAQTSGQSSQATSSDWFWQKRGSIATAALVACVFVAAMLALWPSQAVLTASNPTPITQSHTRILSPLLSDGVHIFYPRYDSGRYSVAAVPVGGGQSTDLKTSLTNPELCDLSPDGRKMLLRDLVGTRDQLNPLYVQPEGGAAVKVGDLLAYDAAWYPDGKNIVYSADGVVYSTDKTGSSRRSLFAVPGNAYWFRWSPDGKRLRFTVIDKSTEETSLWEAAASGEQLHRLFPKVNNQLCCGSWTGDGKFFLFQAHVDSRFEVWAHREGGLYSYRNKPFPLVAGAEDYRGPLTAKDGKTLFLRTEAPKGDLVRYDAKIGEFLPVVPAISVRTLAYSRDGKWIAYTSLTDDNLWRCRADGTQCLELTRGFKDTVMPSWSPDGQTIAFMGNSHTGPWAIYAVAANGGPVRILSHAGEAEGYPDWSPDGQRLIFSEVPPLTQPREIHILDVRSNKATALPESAGYSSPRWSPDGRFLVAMHAGDQFLYLFDFGSGKWRPLATVPAYYPNWSHDGKYVYFLSLSAASRAVFRVAIANGAVEKFADLRGVERGPFFLGDWIGLAPDGSPLAVRNSTIEDVYSWDLHTQ